MTFLSAYANLFPDIIANLALLFGILFVFDVSRKQFDRLTWIYQLGLGVILGGFSILIMFFAHQAGNGSFFDARSVLFVIVGYFFGPVTTFSSAIIGIIYRIIKGGYGVFPGISSIVTASLVGIFWSSYQHKLPRQWPAPFKFYLMGIVAHIFVLLSQLLMLPFEVAVNNVKMFAIPFLVFYPLAVLIISMAMQQHNERFKSQSLLKSQTLLLQSAIDSASEMEIYVVDTNYNYLTFNRYHRNSMVAYYDKPPLIGDNFLSFVVDDRFRNRLQQELDLALRGTSHMSSVEIEVTPGKFFESYYNPVFNYRHQIIGVSVFSKNITERIVNEREIEHLSFHDPLTGLKNRRFYQEEIERLAKKNNLEVVFVMMDINGLKIMNDAFGHHIGDRLLKMVSQNISQLLPNKTEFMRIGGDEFFIIFYEYAEKQVIAIIEDINEKLGQLVINGIHVSVAFGIQRHNHQDETIIDSIRLAEKKMYTKKLSEVSSARHETIRAILNTLHIKNRREEAHSRRVATICQKLGEKLNLRRDDIELLTTMAHLHDIGKIAIDEGILNKESPLTEAEWFEIKKHPETGYHILLTSPEYAEIAEDILSHHERWDGQGYPRGLNSSDIPFRARIIAIADSYDAMTSERPYRQALSAKAAYQEIEKNAGTQFDPQIAEIFLQLLKENNFSI